MQCPLERCHRGTQSLSLRLQQWGTVDAEIIVKFYGEKKKVRDLVQSTNSYGLPKLSQVKMMGSAIPVKKRLGLGTAVCQNRWGCAGAERVKRPAREVVRVLSVPLL